MLRLEGFVTMPCAECRGRFDLGARIASLGKVTRCADCRSKRETRVTPAHRKYWTDRYTREEILALANGLDPGL
jgi:hypothetical protein